jgi:AcrR family transcriptional regulator
MARPKKDPSIRQHEFMAAAKQSFFAKGYDNTSIQDILQNVGEKSVSPSVFYYYFTSKEDIYHAVMESYIEEYMEKLENCLHDESMKIEERIAAMMSVFIDTLAESKKAIDISAGINNRLFVLDLRERITRRIAGMWEMAIVSLPWFRVSDAEAKRLALYVTGGICEMIYDYVFEKGDEQKDIHALTDAIIRFSAAVLDVPKIIQKKFLKDLNKAL